MRIKGVGRSRSKRAMSLFGTCAALILITEGRAEAAGFYLQEQSVRGWGRANSGEVADQGPASLWWNPASIGGIKESSATFSAVAVFPSGHADGVETTIDRPVVAPAAAGGVTQLRNPVKHGVAPGNALALRLSDRLAVGVAVTSPYSFTSDYDPNGWQRYATIRSRLITLDIQPSVAFAANEWLSLGAGLNVEYSDAFLSNALPNLTPGSEDGRLRLDGSGWDFGWSVGAQARPTERLSLGIAYKSAVDHKLGGTVEISGLAGPLAVRNGQSDTVARFTTPWQLTMGLRAGLSERLTLNAQAVRFGWSKFDRIELAAPLNSAIDQNYKDTWNFAAGVDYELSDRLTLRAGIQIDPTPSRDANRSPRVPDADRIDYNLGASFRLTQRAMIEAAAGYTDLSDIPISRDDRFYAGTAAQTDVLTRGRIHGSRVLGFMMGGRFSF